MSNKLTQENLYAMSDEELMSASISLTEPETTPETDDVEKEDTDKTDEPMQESQEHSEESEEEKDSLESTDETDKEVDYKAFYETMTKPFKANGRDVQITNADDAIRLMQQGANYSKRMEELKPKRALIKALEDNGLADKEKLGFLIDLAKKDTKAIAKLIKESEIDLYDIDTEQADSYQPNYQITEPTAFEDVMNELVSNDPSFIDTLTLMGNWDTTSKDAMYNQPEMLREIARQKANGSFDKIVAIVENERMLGRMTDIPFLQAYAQVESQVLNNQQSFTAPRPNQNQSADNNADKKKKASTPTNTKGASTQILSTSDLYKLSDEEIIKLIESGELQ